MQIRDLESVLVVRRAGSAQINTSSQNPFLIAELLCTSGLSSGRLGVGKHKFLIQYPNLERTILIPALGVASVRKR
jgi:hypothetical protein